MTNVSPKMPPLYPKSHLLAASGIAALLSLALLVFPSSDVEAKRTSMNLELDTPADALKDQPGPADDAPPTDAASPFAQIEGDAPADEGNAELATPQPVADLTASASATQHRQVVVAKGDTLSTLFQKVGLSPNEVQAALDADPQAKQFTHLKRGQILQFELSADGQLQSLHTQLSHLESIRLQRNASGFAFDRSIDKPIVRNAYAHGVINSSLSLSAQKAGLSHAQIMDLANIFGYDLDFTQDIHQGDQFDVIYEQKMLAGKVVGTGSILAARFVSRGKNYTAVRYTSKQGNGSYYTADGNSMRKAFVRSPVDFARISSRFSGARQHPILNKIRAHQGVDYAAARGTPIKATGDGKVILAGRKGGYGNTVIIQHGQTYRTLYGHMQGFAKGIRDGSAVKQGQVIGYIGTTGLATGPHVHYEFQVNGVHVDPLGQKLPMADPIARNDRQRFTQMSQALMAQMEQERATLLASSKR